MAAFGIAAAPLRMAYMRAQSWQPKFGILACVTYQLTVQIAARTVLQVLPHASTRSVEIAVFWAFSEAIEERSGTSLLDNFTVTLQNQTHIEILRPRNRQ